MITTVKKVLKNHKDCLKKEYIKTIIIDNEQTAKRYPIKNIPEEIKEMEVIRFGHLGLYEFVIIVKGELL